MRVLVILAVLSCVLWGCDVKNNSFTPVEFSDTVITVGFGQTVNIPNTDLALRFNRKLFDARFPADMPYSPWWSNSAGLEISVQPVGQKMRLYMSGEINDSTGTHFNGSIAQIGDLIYQISALNPLPPDAEHVVPESLLIATISISKSAMITVPDSPVFPISVGSYWIYADTTILVDNDSIIAVSTDTVTVRDEYTDADGHWLMLSYCPSPFDHGEYSVRGDTVFDHQNGEGVPWPGSPTEYPVAVLRPPNGDSLTYPLVFEGDMSCDRTVYRLDSSFATLAGEFSDTWKYVGGIPNDESLQTQILKPGIGFVYMQYDRRMIFPYIPPTTQRMWLVEYQIK